MENTTSSQRLAIIKGNNAIIDMLKSNIDNSLIKLEGKVDNSFLETKLMRFYLDRRVNVRIQINKLLLPYLSVFSSKDQHINRAFRYFIIDYMTFTVLGSDMTEADLSVPEEE